MENVIYEKGNVYVDTTKYRVDGKTYPINGIASVEMGRVDHKDKYTHTETIPSKSENSWIMLVWLGAAVLGLIIGWKISHGFFSTIISVILWTVGLPVAIHYILKSFGIEHSYVEEKKIEHYKPVPSDYIVKISTSAGDTDSYKSQDQDLIAEIVDAITTAITNRG